MHQSTLCAGNVSVRRMKEITERKVLIKNYQADYLSNYANKSPRSENLFELMMSDTIYNDCGYKLLEDGITHVYDFITSLF